MGWLACTRARGETPQPPAREGRRRRRLAGHGHLVSGMCTLLRGRTLGCGALAAQPFQEDSGMLPQLCCSRVNTPGCSRVTWSHPLQRHGRLIFAHPAASGEDCRPSISRRAAHRLRRLSASAATASQAPRLPAPVSLLGMYAWAACHLQDAERLCRRWGTQASTVAVEPPQRPYARQALSRERLRTSRAALVQHARATSVHAPEPPSWVTAAPPSRRRRHATLARRRPPPSPPRPPLASSPRHHTPFRRLGPFSPPSHGPPPHSLPDTPCLPPHALTSHPPVSAASLADTSRTSSRTGP